ncbi:hypothetical protein [Dictyoglomus thermophilum]|uniref:Uncharacterized protein n=1 Tax=Dictyoglomus thermophilum (strain ATCC 35947 / DSM 3960 / H-6-12) TaxID=309799 RepID=B5YBV8_DICT6|nr:hypothetical protein [Dictyoglomus thermophilum]ACI20026.1 hypothetical protein DICTH_1918 [Dictyoglomus thermophilum H-6-12]
MDGRSLYYEMFWPFYYSFHVPLSSPTPAGGAGAELIGVDPQHDFYHYIKVNVTPTNVDYELVKLSTPRNGLNGTLKNDQLWC